jgi:carbamoyl-phosphate synthase small subunit
MTNLFRSERTGKTRARLCLEDGLVFTGWSFGSTKTQGAEVVFNTSMLGYQEVLSDTSYTGQIVTMAAPQIGNVGSNTVDNEADAGARAAGIVVRELSPLVSNYRSEASLHEYLDAAGIPGIEGLDTRKLVRHLRDHGSARGILTTDTCSDEALVALAREVPDMEGSDLATPITTKAPYTFTRGSFDVIVGERFVPVEAQLTRHVVAVDFGLKVSMLELLVDQGCRVTVVPCTYTAEQILALSPDGVLLTNGPGDPAAVTGAGTMVASLLGKVPVFGICLGHQILALALGARTYKMPFGHRGANHPVVEHSTGKVSITSQNHGFAVDEASMKGRGIVTHASLNDRTVEGLAVPEANAFSVQYHPEASPGPHDARPLFAEFVRRIDQARLPTTASSRGRAEHTRPLAVLSVQPVPRPTAHARRSAVSEVGSAALSERLAGLLDVVVHHAGVGSGREGLLVERDRIRVLAEEKARNADLRERIGAVRRGGLRDDLVGCLRLGVALLEHQTSRRVDALGAGGTGINRRARQNGLAGGLGTRKIRSGLRGHLGEPVTDAQQRREHHDEHDQAPTNGASQLFGPLRQVDHGHQHEQRSKEGDGCRQNDQKPAPTPRAERRRDKPLHSVHRPRLTQRCTVRNRFCGARGRRRHRPGGRPAPARFGRSAPAAARRTTGKPAPQHVADRAR